jgi:hypothetical protein
MLTIRTQCLEDIYYPLILPVGEGSLPPGSRTESGRQLNKIHVTWMMVYQTLLDLTEPV